MSVLEEFGKELYGRLLYGSARGYFDQPVYLREENGKYIPSSWLFRNIILCDALSGYLIEMQYSDLTPAARRDLGLDSGYPIDEVRFFVHAAHVVFVPFGKPGYEFLKNKVAEKFDGKDVGEFLYEQFIARTRSKHYADGAFHGLNDEQKEYIKEFFVNFRNRDEVTYAHPKDVSTLACRLYFALGGLVQKGVSIDYLDKEYLAPIISDLKDVFEPVKDVVYRVRISDFESRIPVREPLDKHEEKYIMKLFGLHK